MKLSDENPYNIIQRIILRIGSGLVYGVMAIMAVYLFMLSAINTGFMVYSDEHIYYLEDIGLLKGIFILALCVLLCSGWKRGQFGAKLSDEQQIALLKRISLTLSVVVSLLMIITVALCELRNVYDQKWMYESAMEMVQGDYTYWMEGNYLHMLAYQNGMSLMEAPFALLFGANGSRVMQFLNIVALFGAYIGIAKIAGRYWGKKMGYVAYIGMVIFSPMWAYVTFVYGTMYAFVFSIWCIYFEMKYEDTDQYRYAVFSGACLCLGMLWKSNASIIWIVVMLMLFVRIVETKKWKTIIAMVIIAGFALAEIKGVPVVMHAITGQETDKGIPLVAWMEMGLQESSIAPGWYNEYPQNLYKNVSHDPDVLLEEVKKSFSESVKLYTENPDYFFRFMGRKNASVWADPAFQSFSIITMKNTRGVLPYWIKDAFYNGGVQNTILYLWYDFLQYAYYLGLLFYVVWGRKQHTLKTSHLMVAILGGFLFHFIAEVKSQYTIPYFVMMIPYMLQGYHMFLKHMSEFDLKTSDGWKKYLNENVVRVGIVIGLITTILSISPGPIATNTVHLGDKAQRQEYIWFCREGIDWKDPNYAKDRPKGK